MENAEEQKKGRRDKMWRMRRKIKRNECREKCDDKNKEE
jgi:hypothetical protein